MTHCNHHYEYTLGSGGIVDFSRAQCKHCWAVVAMGTVPAEGGFTDGATNVSVAPPNPAVEQVKNLQDLVEALQKELNLCKPKGVAVTAINKVPVYTSDGGDEGWEWVLSDNTRYYCGGYWCDVPDMPYQVFDKVYKQLDDSDTLSYGTVISESNIKDLRNGQ